MHVKHCAPFVSRCDQLEWFTKAAWNAAVAACSGQSTDYSNAAKLFTASADFRCLFPTRDTSSFESEKVTHTTFYILPERLGLELCP